MRTVIVNILFLLGIVNLYAQTPSFNFESLSFPSGFYEGQDCIAPQYSVSANNLNDKECEVRLYFHDAFGRQVGVNEGKKDSSGRTYSGRTFTAADTARNTTARTGSGKSNNSASSTSGNKGNAESQNNLIHSNTYYYTGIFSSGGAVERRMDPGPPVNVKIYTDRILFAPFLYRRSGYETYSGLKCEKYVAVDANGKNMPENYLLRYGTELTEFTILNIMGFTTSTQSQIEEGLPPASGGRRTYTPSNTQTYTQTSPSNSTDNYVRQPKVCGLCKGTGIFGKNYAAKYSFSKKTKMHRLRGLGLYSSSSHESLMQWKGVRIRGSRALKLEIIDVKVI